MRTNDAIRRAVVGVACGLLFAGHAVGQTAPAPPEAGGAGVIAYPPAFFAEFKPVHAFDMIQRLPGFSFNGGADVRGFGGAAGNVLIDGERPSSKAVNLDQLLQRIQVSQVERIDLIRGGAPGIEMQGQPVVANVIRKKGASMTRAAQQLVKPFTDGYVGYNSRLEGAWRSGGLAAEGQIGVRKDRTFNWGDGPFSRKAQTGETLQSGQFAARDRLQIFNGNGAGEYRRAQDLLRVNLAAAQEQRRRDETFTLRDAIGPFDQRNDTLGEFRNFEVGGDYSRPLGRLSAQVVGLATSSTEDSDAKSRNRSGEQETTTTAEAGERILRGILTGTAFGGVQLEGGGEGAFNFLDASSTLVVNGASVPLPSQAVRVEERRGEAFFTASLKPHPRVSLEAGARYERSTISQTGGANQEKNLAFFKPRLIASWTPAEGRQVRVRIEREVGQLDFGDFATSGEIDTGAVNAGNPDLVPERNWTIETALERRFWGAGAVVLTLTHQKAESVADLIPIAGRFDAPGNIGDGIRQSARVTLNLPLDRLGVAGGLFKFNGTWRRSEVTDPVTGAKRAASYQRPFEGDFLLSKAMPSLNSNLSLEATLGFEETAYRINEVRFFNETPFLKAFWDWTPRPDLIFRFQIENFTAKTQVRKRTLYAGPRSQGMVSLVERREMQLDPFFMTRIRKTF